MNSFVNRLINLCLFLLILTESAQAVEKTTQAWPTVAVDGNFSPSWKYNFMVQARTIPNEQKLQQLLLVPSIDYQLVPGLFTLWQGFTWQSTNVDEDSLLAGREERPWQKLDWQVISAAHFSLLLGNRLEERKEEAFSQWAYRYREKMTLRFPGFIQSATPVLWDEAFFNLNQPAWVTQTTFEQNRFYAGLNLNLNSHLNFDIGYLNQYQFRDPEDQMNNVIYFQMNLSL